MGSLIGHVVPGTAFTLFALWWTFDFCSRFFESKLRRVPLHLHRSTEAAAAAVMEGGAKKPPWEIYFRLIAILGGMAGEFWTALDDQWHFATIHNGQHMTMFGFFLLPTIFELMYVYHGHYAFWLPPSLDIISAGLAFAVEGVLFVWHLHGRSSLDTQVHTFLVYTVVLCCASLTLECCFPHDIRPCLLRCTFTLLQGTWFFCIGFILYPPEGWTQWKGDDHTEMMLVTMMFVWVLAAVLVLQALLAVLSYKVTRKRNGAVFGSLKTDLEKNGHSNGYTHLVQQADSLLSDDEE